jgi:hypothetical protein
VRDEPGAYRIQHDVATDLKEVSITVYEPSAESAL